MVIPGYRIGTIAWIGVRMTKAEKAKRIAKINQRLGIKRAHLVWLQRLGSDFQAKDTELVGSLRRMLSDIRWRRRCYRDREELIRREQQAIRDLQTALESLEREPVDRSAGVRRKETKAERLARLKREIAALEKECG